MRRSEAKRAFAAMMPMKKIDVAAIEAARRQSGAGHVQYVDDIR